MKRYKCLAIALFLMLISSVANADVVWPAMVLETRLFSWWAIGIGLVAEYLFVRWLFNLPIQRAVIATLVANGVSTIAGLFLIPIAGFVWEMFPGLLYNQVLHWGTFNSITWAATFILACLINTVIEATVYRDYFKLQVHHREFWWLVLANAASVGVAFVTIFLVPVEL